MNEDFANSNRSGAEGTAPAASSAPAPANPPAPAAPAANAPAASNLTVGQRLAAAAASLSGKGTSAEVEALKTQLATVTAERNKLQATVTGLQADLKAANDKLAEAESAVTDFEKKVAASAVDHVAAAGIPIKQLPAAEASGKSGGVPATREELEAKMKNLSVGESLELLRKFNAAHSQN